MIKKPLTASMLIYHPKAGNGQSIKEENNDKRDKASRRFYPKRIKPEPCANQIE